MTERTNWPVIILAVLLLASAGYNIYQWMSDAGISLPGTDIYTNSAQLADTNDARAIKPCVYQMNQAGVMQLDSCWGDSIVGGTISTGTLLQLFLQNPDSVNCISYTFGFDNKSANPRKMFLILHGNHVEISGGVCDITKVSGRSFAADWMCPNDCPHD